MSIKTLTGLALTLLLAACTGAVAPTNEGGGTKSLGDGTDNTTGGTTTGDEGSGTAGDEGSGTAGDEGGEGSDDSGSTSVTPLGTVASETTDIADFKGKSTYIMNLAASGMNSLTVANYVVGDTFFKKIKEYKACEKVDTTTTAATTKSVTLTFMKSFTADPAHKVDDNGFPKEDANPITDPADFTAGVSGSFYDSSAPSAAVTVKTGTITFAAGKRPAAAKDPYEVAVDLTLSDGKKYKATLTGIVDAIPEQPTAPTCPEGEYAPAVYED